MLSKIETLVSLLFYKLIQLRMLILIKTVEKTVDFLSFSGDFTVSRVIKNFLLSRESIDVATETQLTSEALR